MGFAVKLVTGDNDTNTVTAVRADVLAVSSLQ
jgi:hypothetical protein